MPLVQGGGMEIIMKDCVLLTGGAGFIGSHIAERLVAEEYKVVVVDNLSSGSLENLKKIKNCENFNFFKIDIRDIAQLEKIFIEYKPKVVNHHAAQKSVPYSVDNPLLDASINILGLLNLIVLSGKYEVESFIYVSSGGALSKEIKGDEKSVESDLPQLASPYAINKYMGEKYIEMYSKEHNYNYTILRYANVYGPRQIIDGESGVIPIFIKNILKGRKSVLMTYDDMPRGCTRDYVYVSDVVEANLMAMKQPVNAIVNIGSSKEVAIMDIYDIIQSVFKTNYDIEIIGNRKGDIKRSVLNTNKAYELWKWKPSVDLIQGIIELKDYYDNIKS